MMMKNATLNVIEIEDALAIRTCKMYNYKYAVITPNDIVVPPPKNDNVSKIRWKNFLSTGDQFSEIDFQKNATNLIVGTNGTGKSTVLDA